MSEFNGEDAFCILLDRLIEARIEVDAVRERRGDAEGRIRDLTKELGAAHSRILDLNRFKAAGRALYKSVTALQHIPENRRPVVIKEMLECAAVFDQETEF